MSLSVVLVCGHLTDMCFSRGTPAFWTWLDQTSFGSENKNTSLTDLRVAHLQCLEEDVAVDVAGAEAGADEACPDLEILRRLLNPTALCIYQHITVSNRKGEDLVDLLVEGDEMLDM